VSDEDAAGGDEIDPGHGWENAKQAMRVSAMCAVGFAFMAESIDQHISFFEFAFGAFLSTFAVSALAKLVLDAAF
jgi:hypothetical protein